MVVLTPFIPYIAGAVGFGSSLLDNQRQNAERDARNAEIRAQNRANRQQYQYDVNLAQQSNRYKLQIWDQKKSQYRDQLQYNSEELGRAYTQEQTRLNDMFDRFKGQNKDMMVQLLEANSAAAASGQQGKRSGMRRVANLQAFGDANTRLRNNLSREQRNSKTNMENYRRKTLMANRQAWADVSVAPMLAPMPLAPTNRSQISYNPMMGVFGSLLNGVQSGLAFGK